MNDFVITDNLTNQRIHLTFSEFYDLKIGLLCASEMYGEVNRKERQKQFEKLAELIGNFCED